MPLKSKAQQKLMFATLAGADTGVPKDVAQDFIKNTSKKQFQKLRDRLRPLKKGTKYEPK
jgi:hypothetical protein